MHSVTAANARWEAIMGKGSSAAGVNGDAFSTIFDSLKTQAQGKGSSDSLMSFFGDRFPNARIREGEVGNGIKGAEEFFGDEEGDQVAFDSSAIAGMLGDGSLARQIEEALSKFFDTTNSQAPEGMYSQRRVSVTITTIRFSVSQREEGTGDLQSSEELKAALGEKIKEMIDSFFGKGAGKAGESEAAAAAVASVDNTATGNGTPPVFNYGSSWSMEFFFSQSFTSSMTMGDDSPGMDGQGAMSSSWSASFSAFGQSMSGSFFQAMGMSGNQFGSGPFTSLLGGSLDQFGLSADSFDMSASGYSMRIRESRNLMSELMELYGSRIHPKESEDSAVGDATPEPAEVDVVAEEPVATE